jgi:hypothetical protein
MESQSAYFVILFGLGRSKMPMANMGVKMLTTLLSNTASAIYTKKKQVKQTQRQYALVS